MSTNKFSTLFFIFSWFSVANLFAQKDSLFVKRDNTKAFYIEYFNTDFNASVIELAKSFSAPASQLASYNKLSLNDFVPATGITKVPLGKFNYIKTLSGETYPIYYKVQRNEQLSDISRQLGIAQSELQRLNNLNSQEIYPGEILILGAVKHRPQGKINNRDKMIVAKNEPNRLPNIDTSKPTILPIDTIVNIPLSEEQVVLDSIYAVMEQNFYQQSRGKNANEASGAAVFFKPKISTPPGVYYALHNDAARGTLIQVFNPESNKTIYAKVIGAIPNLKEYQNSIVVISGNAAKSLEAPYKRTFCKIMYLN